MLGSLTVSAQRGYTQGGSPAPQTAGERPRTSQKRGADAVAVEIQAESLSFSPHRNLLEARGDLTIRLDLLTIRASALVLSLRTGAMMLTEPLIAGSGDLRIKGARATVNGPARTMLIDRPQIIATPDGGRLAIRGRLAACGPGGCVLRESRGTACPHQPVGYEVRTKETKIHPSGDIDLLHPVVYLGDTPVMALPWLRIRPPRAVGFLPPRIGWDRRAGFIAGPAGLIPIGPDGSIHGHLAARTSQGFEALAHLTTSPLDLRVDHLLDAPHNHARIRAHARPPLKGASLVIDSDIPSSLIIVDDLARAPLERALTHTMSRALWAADIHGLVLETSFELIHTFDSEGDLSTRFGGPRSSIALTFVPSSPLADLLWPSADVSVTRFDALGADLALDALSLFAPSHIRARGGVGLDLPVHLGPFDVEGRVVSNHQLWLPDSPRYARTSAHLIAAEILAALPLMRRFSTLDHTVSPFARYRITPWLHGRSPAWVMDDFDRLERGHGVEIGLRTALGRRKEPSVASFEVIERIYLQGFEQRAGPSFLWGELGFGRPRFRVLVDGALDHQKAAFSTAGASISVAAEQGSAVEMGARWIGPGQGPHLDPTWHTAAGPFLVKAWPAQPDEALEVLEKTDIRLTKRFKILAGARVGVYPRASLHALWYGVELGSACGCLSAGLVASHRPRNPIPDVMATFSMTRL